MRGTVLIRIDLSVLFTLPSSPLFLFPLSLSYFRQLPHFSLLELLLFARHLLFFTPLFLSFSPCEWVLSDSLQSLSFSSSKILSRPCCFPILPSLFHHSLSLSCSMEILFILTCLHVFFNFSLLFSFCNEYRTSSVCCCGWITYCIMFIFLLSVQTDIYFVSPFLPRTLSDRWKNGHILVNICDIEWRRQASVKLSGTLSILCCGGRGRNILCRFSSHHSLQSTHSLTYSNRLVSLTNQCHLFPPYLWSPIPPPPISTSLHHKLHACAHYFSLPHGLTRFISHFSSHDQPLIYRPMAVNVTRDGLWNGNRLKNGAKVAGLRTDSDVKPLSLHFCVCTLFIPWALWLSSIHCPSLMKSEHSPIHSTRSMSIYCLPFQ